MIVNGFKCPKCTPDGSIRFQTLAEYHGHMIGVHKLKHVCHHCPFTSKGASGLQQHGNVHKPFRSLLPKYQCDICPSDPGAWFTSRNLSQHRKNYHWLTCHFEFSTLRLCRRIMIIKCKCLQSPVRLLTAFNTQKNCNTHIDMHLCNFEVWEELGRVEVVLPSLIRLKSFPFVHRNPSARPNCPHVRYCPRF